MPTKQEIQESFSELTDKWCDIIAELCNKAYEEGYKNGKEENDKKGLDGITEKPQSN